MNGNGPEGLHDKKETEMEFSVEEQIHLFRMAVCGAIRNSTTLASKLSKDDRAKIIEDILREEGFQARVIG